MSTIRYLRGCAKLSLRDLERATHIDHSLLSRIENGKVPCYPGYERRIASALCSALGINEALL